MDENNAKNVSVNDDVLMFKKIETYRTDKHELTPFFSRPSNIASLDKRLTKISSELRTHYETYL